MIVLRLRFRGRGRGSGHRMGLTEVTAQSLAAPLEHRSFLEPVVEGKRGTTWQKTSLAGSTNPSVPGHRAIRHHIRIRGRSVLRGDPIRTEAFW
jgi:hypothetical protein